MTVKCTCQRVVAGNSASFGLNWNPECEAHGLTSDWWNSKEQIEQQAKARLYSIELQRKAREARKRAQSTGKPEETLQVDDDGDSSVDHDEDPPLA